MKLVSLLPSLALLASFTLSTALPTALDALDLEKRAPEPLPAPVSAEEGAALEERGKKGGDDVRVDINIKIKVKKGRPRYDWKHDGSGFGYGVDYRGRKKPRYYPDGWQYFGRDIGWAPYKGWRPRERWEPVEIFIRIMIRVDWWSPPDYWKKYWYSRYPRSYYKYGFPSHWDWKPKDPYRGGRWYEKGGGWYYGKSGWKREEGGAEVVE
ncbi:hypothetical protein JCM8547_008345 [Rhodosporidiobolus lusitaniae]